MGRSEQSPFTSRSPPLAAALEGQAAPPTRGRDRAVAVLRHLPSNVVRARGEADTVPRSRQRRSESRWLPRRRNRFTPAGSAGRLDARHGRRCASQSAARRIIEFRESGAAPRSDALANDASSALSKPAVGGGARGARLLQLGQLHAGLPRSTRAPGVCVLRRQHRDLEAAAAAAPDDSGLHAREGRGTMAVSSA